jgi:exopolysaccharide biosynthesis polyprenyl glycosylphosphotransferase
VRPASGALAPGIDGFGRVGAGHDGMMSRVFGHHVSPELFGLWCIEVLGCSLLAYLLLSAGLPDGLAGNLLRLHAASQAVVLALTVGVVSFAAGLYSPDLYGETRRLLAGSALGGCLALPAAWLAGHAAGIDFNARAGTGALLLAALAGWVLFVLAVRLAFSHAVRANLFVRRVLVVGAGSDDAAAVRLVAALRSLRRGSFRVISVLAARDAARLTPALLKGRKIWGIIVTDAARGLLVPEQLAGWQKRGCRLHGEAEFWETRLRRIDIDHPVAAGTPQPSVPRRRVLDAALSRAADILLGLLLLLFTMPLMLVTALLVKFDSPGPVLYRQERVGLHGRLFTVLKFRSMRVDAEARGPVWASARDPRVTRIGALIRRTRIDELPQLVNVLRGEMSFIGPRPERPHFVEQLTGAVPLYCERAQVKPGLTGWAQVNYPYGASVEDARAKLSYDLYYVKHRSPALAVLILVSTVWVVLFQKGAR